MIVKGISINPQNIKKIEREIKEKSKKLKFVLNSDNSNVVIPHMVVSGTTILTDTGEYRSNEDLRAYGQRKVLWNGKDSVILIPKDGVKLIPKDKNGNVISDDSPADHYEKEWQEKCDYKVGLVQSHTLSMAVSNSHLFDDVKETQNIEQVDFIFKDWNIDENYLEYFYEIPGIAPNVWFKIDNAIKEYVEGQLYITHITFSSINDELSNTGRAIDQYFHRSAPGEGYGRYLEYIDPKIDKKTIRLDKSYIVDTPITSAQVELYGSGIIHSFLCIGRSIDYNKENVIQPSKILLASNFLTPDVSFLTKQSLPTSTFYTFMTGHPDQRFYFKDKNTEWSSYFDEKTRPDNQGFFIIQSTMLNLRKTNNHKTLLGEDVNDSVLDNILPNDGTLPPFTTRGKMWDDYNIKSNNLLNISQNVPIEKTIKYWVDAIPFLDTVKNSEISIFDGVEYHYIDIPLEKAVKKHDLLNLFSLMMWSTIKLPMDLTTVVSWNVSTIPVIGGLFSLLGLGKTPNWNSISEWTPNKLYPGFIPSITAEYCATYFNTKEKLIIPYGILRNDTSDTSDPMVGTKSQNTTLRIQLTDKVSKYDDESDIYHTLDLGQNQKDTPNKVWKMGFATHKALPEMFDNNNKGFLIDKIIFGVSSKSNYRLTFYHGNERIWQGRYMTESKWDNTDRSITNIINLSPWNDNLSGSQTFNYPKPFKPSQLPKEKYYFVPIENLLDTRKITGISAGSQFTSNYIIGSPPPYTTHFETGEILPYNISKNIVNYTSESVNVSDTYWKSWSADLVIAPFQGYPWFTLYNYFEGEDIGYRNELRWGIQEQNNIKIHGEVNADGINDILDVINNALFNSLYNRMSGFWDWGDNSAYDPNNESPLNMTLKTYHSNNQMINSSGEVSYGIVYDEVANGYKRTVEMAVAEDIYGILQALHFHQFRKHPDNYTDIIRMVNGFGVQIQINNFKLIPVKK